MLRFARIDHDASPHRRAALLAGIAAVAGLGDATFAAAAPAAGDRVRPHASIVGGAPLAPAAVDRLDALNGEAARAFIARRSPVHGMARALTGGRLELGASDLAAAALSFIERHGALLGLPTGLDPVATVNGRKVRVAFTFHGLQVLQTAATLTFDRDGDLVAVSASAHGPALPLGLHELDDAASIAAAGDAIDRERARHARPAGVRWSGPQLERAWLATATGLLPVIRVGLTGDRPGESFEAWLDARDGTPQRVLDRVRRGEGFYPLDPQRIPFPTKSAKGTAFKSVAQALSSTPSTRTLKNWSAGVPAPIGLGQGFLVGAHADIWDDNDDNAFSSNGVFTTTLVDDPDLFDQVNTYYQIEEFFCHLTKQLGVAPASGHSLPVIVNVKTSVPNAFFVADTFPIDGHTVGYLQFHDLEQDFGPIGDFSRDPTVVAHEYVHAWLAFEGESTFDPLDYPTRAVGEAIPDFFACAFHGQTVIGEYLDEAMGLGIARDLQDDDHLAITIDDAIALTATGLPEEHRAGEVMGSLLTDLRIERGTKVAERIVFDALPGIPDAMADLGFGVVDAGNAFVASADYLLECALALMDATTTDADFAAVLGAATTRGVIGHPASSANLFVALDGFSRGKLTIPAAFIARDVEQSFFFTAPAGSRLTVTITADRGGALPDFEIVDAATRTLFPYVEQNARKFTGGHRKVTASKLDLLLADNEVYEFIVINDGLDGAYTLTLDI